MTKRVNRPHRKTGRKPKTPPANAAARIEAFAAAGHDVIGIAKVFGTTKDVLARWVKEDPAIGEAMEAGREAERYALHNRLYRAAMKGNIVAAMFLLKARHGYKEGDPANSGNRVQINFTLPAAVNEEQYKVIENESLALPRARPPRS